jgi:hypothetical protein
MTQPLSPRSDVDSPSPLLEVIPQIWPAANGKKVIWLDMIFNQKEQMLKFWEIFQKSLDVNIHQLMQLPSNQLNSSKGCMRIMCDATKSYSMLVLVFQYFPSLSPSSFMKDLNLSP